MNSPLSLFIRRLKVNISFQYSVIRIVADLTVALYTVVPALIALGAYYYHLWVEQPSFLFNTPLSVVSIVFFIIIAMSTVRSYYEYGDQLSLIQQKHWYYSLKKYGVYYTLLTHSVKSLLVFSLFLPLLYVGLKLTVIEIVLLYILTSLMRTNYAIVKRRIAIMSRPVKKVSSFIGLFLLGLFIYEAIVLSQSIYIYLIAIVLLTAIIVTYATRGQKNYATHFIALASYDLTDRYKYLRFILTTGENKINIPKVKQTKLKPKLFKRSNPLFKARTDVNILIENAIKHFIRKKGYVFLYLQLVTISCYGLYLLPLEARILLVFAFSLIYLFVGKGIWRMFMADDFMKLYKWDDMVKMKAMQKASVLFALPAFTILTVLLLVLSPSLIMLLIHLAVAALGYTIIYIVSSLTVK